MTFLIQLLIEFTASRAATPCPPCPGHPRGLSLFDLNWR